MKILILNKYWRQAGGVEVHQFEVAAWLESLGHTVIPFAMSEKDTFANEYQQYFPSAVEFRGSSLKETARGVIRATVSTDARKKLRELIDREQPDAAYVLHIYHQLGTSLLNVLDEAGVPTVLSIHDYKIACPNYRLYSEADGSMCLSCMDGKLKFATAPIVKKCWSGSATAGVALALEATATKLRKSYLKPKVVTYLNGLQKRAALFAGIEEERLHLVPHPVELFESREPIQPDAPFLYLGRLVPEKGVEVLIRAAARAQTPVVIAGEGRSRKELESLARELDAPVEFIGSVDRDEVASLMRSSRALVVPSTWHEVSPLVVYEAIANDVPVIASAVGGMTDQLGEGRGYLFEASDVPGLETILRETSADYTATQLTSNEARKYAAVNWSRASWEANMRNAFASAGTRL